MGCDGSKSKTMAPKAAETTTSANLLEAPAGKQAGEAAALAPAQAAAATTKVEVKPEAAREATPSQTQDATKAKKTAPVTKEPCCRQPSLPMPMDSIPETSDNEFVVSDVLSAKSIRKISNFAELYVLGKEVMPSGSAHTVRFATRCCDGLDVVVKCYAKRNFFPTAVWREGTELLLNIPSHANIVELYEVLEDASGFYVVMEKVIGMDLYESLQRGRMSLATVHQIVQQLLQAVAHLHSHDVLHRDLKLENIMMDSSQGQVSIKVIDFDTVRPFTRRRARKVVGTTCYIPQEAYAGKYSPQSDVFSVGVIAYKLLSRRWPFETAMFVENDGARGELDVGSAKMNENRQRLSLCKVDFSDRVFRDNPVATEFVERMLSHSWDARPSVADALKHTWLQEDPTSL